MRRLHLHLLVLCVSVLGLAGWSFNPTINHLGQPENWACGPTTIAMWANYINNSSSDIYDIADVCDAEDGTTIPEFLTGIFEFTPYGYVFSEWEYSDAQAAVKGVMWTISRFDQPVAVAGGSGTHYILIRGGQADSDPYSVYSESNHINYVYINDATEDSPHYGNPVSGMYADDAHSPETLMTYWVKIGAIFDKKYRSMERNCNQCWSTQGATYNNNDNFSDY